MASVTLAVLRSRVRQAADMESSQFVTDAALDGFINAEAGELYDLIVTKFRDYFGPAMAEVPLVAGASEYALPADFYKLRGVDVNIGSRWHTVPAFSFAQRNRYADTSSDLRSLRYLVRGNKLVFAPTPGAAGSVRLWYTPTRTPYVASSDAFDWVNGWEDFIVHGAAARCAVKEETDPSPHMAMKESARRRVEDAASIRDAAEPGSVGGGDSWDDEDPWLVD